MKIQFESNQQYQIDAVNAVVNVFKGQPAEESFFHSEMSQPDGRLPLNGQMVVANRLVLSDETLLNNVQQVQKENSLGLSERLGKRNFTVEMETGTGKTYVYLRTIHELNQRYGFSKFIIVVPSIAIKEGIIKNLEITREHFDTLFEHPEMDFYVWNPKKKGQARNFATANSLQILVMNVQAFAGKGRIIHQESDWGVPIDFLKATNPILIIDEPQNMESDIRRNAIEELNPLCTLRYSATHKEPYNLVYKLDPVKAYDLGLVKKIEVDSIIEEDNQNGAFVQLIDVVMKGRIPKAKIRIKSQETVGIKDKDVSVKVEDNLFHITNEHSMYRDGFIVEEIDAQEKKIKFTNGVVLYSGETNGRDRDEIMKFQILRTVQNHFNKELMLENSGVKVLTLFFIDKVENYRSYENGSAVKGKIAKWFEEAYNEVTKNPQYKSLCPFDAHEVHNGYFSQDKKGLLKNTSGRTEADNDTYALIMKDKERLLSLSEPLRFIFSHSALTEGWDNPNVFQICTLNEVSSEMKKRQQIGRGLRLPVNDEGKRVTDSDVNILTVIANESYEGFARSLQKEIEEETGVTFSGRIKPARERRTLRVGKKALLNPDFQELWKRINKKTIYRVQFSTEELIEKAAEKLKEDIEVKSPKFLSIRASIDLKSEGVKSNVKAVHSRIASASKAAVPDVLTYIQKKTKLSKQTVFEMIEKSDTAKEILKNPQQYMDQAEKLIKNVLGQLMIEGIKYEKIAGQSWEMRLFEEQEIQTYLSNLYHVRNEEKTIYDHVVIDSAVESSFAKELDSREDVKFYLKLPNWFKIPTPIGSYNPDWAIVFHKDKRIYFVAETKGDGELRPSEEFKIACGKKHFEELKGVHYQKVLVKGDQSNVDRYL